MTAKLFTYTVIVVTIVLLTIIMAVNFKIDPYDFYGNNLFNQPKTQEINQLRLAKAIKLEKKQPKSIILGTSRAEFGFNPDHNFFTAPGYSVAVGGSSISEAFRYLKHSNKNNKLEQVLLVADYIMFNSNEQYKIPDFESYFENPNLTPYLLNTKTLKDSALTLNGTNAFKYTIYNENGQREHTHNRGNLIRFGGQKKKMSRQFSYFKNFNNDNHYRDSGKSAFTDFENLVRYCLQNNIELEIIFGPNHALHWESFDYYIGLEKWYEWKALVTNTTSLIAENENAQSPRIVDYSIFNEYTLESIPSGKTDFMQYHWELNHYRPELGDIILSDLTLDSPIIGIELNSNNITNHIDSLKADRQQYISIDKYLVEVLKNRKPNSWNNYMSDKTLSKSSRD